MRARRWSLAAVVGVLGAVVAPAATTPVAAAQPVGQQGVTLRVALTRQVDSLNPFLSITQVGTEVGRLMYDFLTAYDPKDQRPVEGLANGWTTSDDDLTWTFTVPEGKKWSDGEEITAEDVAFTYNLMLTNEVARTANGNFVANFESVTAPDPRTLVVRTKTPQATMLALDVPIVPEHVWAGVTDVENHANDQAPVVGSGPFLLAEHRPNEFIKLTANPNYWRGAPKISELHFVSYKNLDAAVQALGKGEVDLINRLGPAQYDSLRDADDIGLNKGRGSRFNELVFNSGAATSTGEPIGDGHPALQDVRVRQALAKAVDVDTIVERVNGGYAEPGTGLMPPSNARFHFTPARPRTFDLDAANADLDAAGYARGADGIRVGPDGRALNLRLVGHANRAYDEQAAEFLKRSFADVGVGVDVQLVDDNQLNDTSTSGAFDLLFSSWGTNPDPDFILSLHTCARRPNAAGTGGTTDTFFCDETYDRLYAQQATEVDQDARAEIVKEMQQRFYDQVPAVILGYDNVLEAYREDRFASFQVQPDPGGSIMEQNGVWGYYGATPTDAATAPRGTSTGLVVAVVAGVVIVLAGGAWLIGRRRRATAEDRE
ncbi:ABC transporter substrate-binding protein [Umezawaea beigongshangensis]|uniref:ABC transporter substrate-binding protein n=1 Tax=Umezawaea beigongshangensis TaxID=2780383 RepID=UPI0027DABAB9|nr:ABC transporter substrate-binding protein [Umezawaea beigongshangensis]